MKILTIKDLFKNIPNQFDRIYQFDSPTINNKNIYDKLMALTDEELTKQNIDSIIGNTNWTRFACDECGIQVDVLIIIGSFYDKLGFCKNCIKKSLDMLEQHNDKINNYNK